MNFSRIQLGTVQFGLNYGIANTGGKPSYESSRDIVATAYQGEINCFDTAAAYGDSEVILGRALNELKLQEKVHIISKIAPFDERDMSSRETEEFIITSVENSLKRLQRDYLDVCLFHRDKDYVYFDVLDNLKSRGLIRGFGLSIDSTDYCDKLLESQVKFIQLPYNILDKRFDDFLIQAAKRNIKVFTRSLYLQGLLLMAENQIKPFLQDVIPIRRELEQLASDSGMTMPELCARFVLSNPAVTSILTGVDNLQQLQQNIELLSKAPLPEDIYQQVKSIVPVFDEKIIRPARWTQIA